MKIAFFIAVFILLLTEISLYHILPKYYYRYIKKLSADPTLPNNRELEKLVKKIVNSYEVRIQEGKMKRGYENFYFFLHCIAPNLFILTEFSFLSKNNILYITIVLLFINIFILFLNGVFCLDRYYLLNSSTKVLFSTLELTIMFHTIMISILTIFPRLHYESIIQLIYYVIMTLIFLFVIYKTSKLDYYLLPFNSILAILVSYYQFILLFYFKSCMYYHQLRNLRITYISDYLKAVFVYPKHFKLSVLLYLSIHIIIFILYFRILKKAKKYDMYNN